MRRLAPLVVLLAACDPPPSRPARATVDLYMHPNGLSRCVEEDGEKWKADPSCCPQGFTLAGFSVPSVTQTADADGKVTRRLYRHVVCLEGDGGAR